MTEQHYFYGTGRRKNAVAKVRVYNTPGGVTVNGKPLEEAIPVDAWNKHAARPLNVANLSGNVTVVAKTSGGGGAGQAGAVSLGIARALVLMDENLKGSMRKAGLLTRDSRMKESKKYGLKRARKAPQYTKR